MQIHIAAIQMDVTPAPLEARLGRAEELVCQAAGAGAQLVALPEVFNTGYAYTDENFRRAEGGQGPTWQWMHRTAARLGVHLAGTLLLREAGEIYNTLLLAAPDGREWKYRKNFPFAFERRYFKEGRDITVARTGLGDIGLMICADVARPELWRRYAGLVDFMVICSSPPDTGNWVYQFPDGTQVGGEDMGRSFRGFRESVPRTFTEMAPQQAAWLGVPAVNTVACGRFESPVPEGRLALLGLLPEAPRLARLLPQAKHMTVHSAMLEGCQVTAADGSRAAFRSQAEGEGWCSGVVRLADRKPQPVGPQPASILPAEATRVADRMARLCVRGYRQAVKKNG